MNGCVPVTRGRLLCIRRVISARTAAQTVECTCVTCPLDVCYYIQTHSKGTAGRVDIVSVRSERDAEARSFDARIRSISFGWGEWDSVERERERERERYLLACRLTHIHIQTNSCTNTHQQDSLTNTQTLLPHTIHQTQY